MITIQYNTQIPKNHI